MCGIVGTYYFNKQQNTDDKYLNWCLQNMYRRGPDSNGIWRHENYLTGFVRLAIQDTSTHANQPMVSACGNYCLTFNGEIYNAHLYKKNLQDKGIHFTSTGDTEILLYALIHLGLDFVLKEFDGMYAFAFYNKLTNTLIVARDRVGIKPLYVGFNNNNSIIYSSQYNHIINYKSLQQQAIDTTILSNYFLLGFVPDGNGIIKNTLLLPHGYYIEINTHEYKLHQYYLPKHKADNAVITENMLQQAAAEQLISDVPLGTFLSGGVDSSLLTALVNKIKPVTAYTIGTGNNETDEAEKAKSFALRNNIKHVVQNINDIDIHALVNQHIEAYTEPFADYSSLPSLLVSAVAKQNVTVILSGDGPDELFWGYNRNIKMIERFNKYFKSAKAVQLFNYILSKIRIGNPASKQMLTINQFHKYYLTTHYILGSNKWASKICNSFLPTEPFFMSVLFKENYKDATLNDAMSSIWNIEMNIHLQRILLKMDRASMFNSLEARVPYLSNHIIQQAAAINYTSCIVNGIGKYNIKQMLEPFADKEFIYASKKGFDIPLRQIITNKLADRISNSFTTLPNQLSAHLNSKQLSLMLQNHLKGKENNTNIIWAAFVFIEWFKTHVNSYKN